MREVVHLFQKVYDLFIDVLFAEDNECALELTKFLVEQNEHPPIFKFCLHQESPGEYDKTYFTCRDLSAASVSQRSLKIS